MARTKGTRQGTPYHPSSSLTRRKFLGHVGGLSLLPYAGALTVGGELNKLAANISIGRDTAGVRYRSDGVQGLMLGEAVAVSVLRDYRGTSSEPFEGFSLTKFDGTTVTV